MFRKLIFTLCKLDGISLSDDITADAYKWTERKKQSDVFKNVAKSVLWNTPLNANTDVKQGEKDSILTRRHLSTKSIQHTSQYRLSVRVMQHLITLNSRTRFR